MALNSYTVGYSGGPTYAAPTVSETIPTPNDRCLLGVKVGATATTVTIVTPGLLPNGDAIPDKVLGPLTSVDILVKVDQFYADANNNAAVTFSQIASVTACIIRV